MVELETKKQTFIIINVIKNVKICRKFCMNIYYLTSSSSFKKLILSSPLYIIESIIRETQLDWQEQKNFELITPRELLKYFNLYYF